MSEPRRIETTGYAKLAPPASFGRRPRLEWLSIAVLVVDPEYQREISSRGRKNIRGGGRAEELNRTIIVAVIEVLARHPRWRRGEAALKRAFETVNLEDMWRDAIAAAARVKGSSGIELLQRELTKQLERELGSEKGRAA